MKYFFLSAFFFSFLATTYAAGRVNPACLEKEKAVALLETAENFLTKAKISFPSCKEDINPTDELECGSLAYIEVSRNLISDVRKNFPTCTNKDDKIIEVRKPKACAAILESGYKESGLYTIWIGKNVTTRKQLRVYCDMETDGGGWTLIQRRGKFPVQQDFYLDWESYKNGFGNLTREFWLGNENIRLLCEDGCKIRFDLEDKGVKGFALYQNFNLTNENYRINISGYSGSISDGMQYHNNFDFSTKDKGNTKLAEFHKAGWWITSRYYVNLNGIYQPGNSSVENVIWWLWREKANIDSSEIKVKPY